MRYNSVILFPRTSLSFSSARNLRRKFGKNPVLVIGNWSAGMVRYHDPIRSKGLRNALKRYRFQVYLIDKFKTPSYCPVCESNLEKFHLMHNPRPWQSASNHQVKCHGFLRCQNKNCLRSVAKYQDSTRERMWNRDMTAVLNFRHILLSPRTNECIPERFQRSKKHPVLSNNSGSVSVSDGSRPLIELLLGTALKNKSPTT